MVRYNGVGGKIKISDSTQLRKEVKEMFKRGLYVVVLLLAMVSMAHANATITLTPTTEENAGGGYPPGTVVEFKVDISQDTGSTIEIRLAQLDFAASDPGLTFQETFSFDFSSLMANALYATFPHYQQPCTVYTSTSPVPGFILEIPASGSLTLGTGQLKLPEDEGTYLLDALNAGTSDTNLGARIDFGFSYPTRWASWNGSITGGSLVLVVLESGPDITVTDNKGTVDDQDVPFGNVTVDESADAIVTITNDGSADLTLDTITDPASPFSIAEFCSGQSLAPAASCDITVTFAPAAAGAFSDTFSIPSDDPDENPVTVTVSGNGVSPVTQYTLITAVDPADSGTVTLDPAGGTYDEGASVSLTATPNSNYMFDGWDGDVTDADAATTTTTMDAGKTIKALFLLDNDNDGVPTEEEQGPDGTDATYDGDSSGTADSLEDNVTSGHTFDGAYYVTLAAPATQSLANVETNDNPSSSDSPSGASFPYGFFGFEIKNIDPHGSATTVDIYLPAGEAPTTYWKYGPTPTDGTDQWYEFLYDGTTGAEFNDNVITLHFVDGDRGDDDLTANGSVTDIGAPARPAAAGSGGSSGGCFINTLIH